MEEFLLGHTEVLRLVITICCTWALPVETTGLPPFQVTTIVFSTLRLTLAS